MAAQVFLAVFYSSQRPSQQLISTVYAAIPSPMISMAQGICHFAKDCSYKEQMRSAHVLARMIDRNAVASGSYFVVGSIVIGLKVISNNPLDNLPTKCPLQSSKAYKQVGSITLSEWLEMYIPTIYFCIQRTSSRTCS